MLYFELATKAWKETHCYDWKTTEGATLPPYTLKNGNDEIMLCSALIDEVSILCGFRCANSGQGS